MPTTTKNRACIYCGNTNQADFKGKEHVLLKSFGTFGSRTPTLRCVCDGCNQYFMKELDEVFARETLEGITRYKQRIFSRAGRAQASMTISLREGAEAGKFGGMLIGGVDGTTGKLLPPPSQFHVLNNKTGKYDVFTKDQLGSLELPESLYGKAGERQCKAFAPSKEEFDLLLAELHAAGIPYKPEEVFGPDFLQNKKPDDSAELPVVIEGIIDDVRKRALVKMLLNFAAYYLGEGEVMKPQWNKARNFVRHDADPLKARISNTPFWDGQETINRRFASDSYNVRLENSGGNVLGAIQFFNLFAYEFILIENYSLSSSQGVGYRFTPGEEPRRGVKVRIAD